MKNLYGSIRINKILPKENEYIEEDIKYYKTKKEKYGLKIIKREKLKKEKFEINDITDNEETIEKVLNYLVIKQITPESSDVIEDLLKVYACY